MTDNFLFPTIHAAAQAGHVEEVKRFLKSNKFLLNQVDEQGQTPLLLAAREGHALLVQYLSKHWARWFFLGYERIEMNAATRALGSEDNGKTALLWAIERGYCNVVRLLLDAGAMQKNDTKYALPFFTAASSGRVDMVELLLKRDVKLLNKKDKRGQTALIWAASKGLGEVVRYLLKQKGIYLNVSTNSSDTANGRTALLWAARNGHYDVVDMLLDAGARTSGEGFVTCLHLAAGAGHVKIVELLLKRERKLLNKTDSRGKTPLYRAIEAGYCEVVNMLLDAGAEYKPIGDMNFDLIHLAAQAGHVDMVKLFLERDSTRLNKTDAYGQTALLWAASKGHSEVVRYLLTQKEIHLNASTCSSDAMNGWIALDWAASNGHYDVVDMLLDTGASTNGREFSCLHLAAGAGHVKIVELLLKRVPNVLNETNADGKTVLQVAIEEGHCEVVKMLLDAEAEYKPIGEMNFDLMHLAAQAGHVDMVKLLLERDPTRLNKTDAYGQTALLWAASKGHSEVVRYLLAQEGIDLQASTQRPELKEHGSTALQWAIAGAHPVAASLLYHASPDEQHKKALLDLIKKDTVMFDLMIADPRNKAFMEESLVISNFLKTWKVQSDQHFYYYKAAGRRPSFYVEIDKQNGEARVFQKGKELGSGTYGDVVDFVSENNEHRVVKYRKKIWIDEILRQQNRIESSKKEQALRDKAYPGRNFLFDFERLDKEKKQYSLRDVSDFIEGETLADFFPKVTSVTEIVHFFLLITQEMMMLHDKGILHRDCKPDNIMVTNEHQIRFIDFGESRWLSEQAKVRYEGNAGDHPHIAPELFGRFPIKLNVSQDIYSLGHLFLYLLERHIKKAEVYQSFPVIEQFIRSAMNKWSGMRPALATFHAQLTEELQRFNNPVEVVSDSYCGFFYGRVVDDSNEAEPGVVIRL